MRNVPTAFREKLFQPKRWPLFLRSKRLWVVIVVAAGVLVLLNRQADLETVRSMASEMNGTLAFILLTVLPLVGFPVSVLHVVAGMRFGIPLGLSLVSISILLQMLASQALVHWRKQFFAARLKSVREKIPPGSHAAVTTFTVLIPGAPYFAQNYVLPLIGVPLRIYLGIGLPIHIARSAMAVIFGGKNHELTLGVILLMVTYGAAVLTASWWALRRLQMTLEDRPPAENGRKRSG